MFSGDAFTARIIIPFQIFLETSSTFRVLYKTHSAYSELGLFKSIQTYSNIFSIIKAH